MIAEIIKKLKEEKYQCLRVAHHPESERASHFYRSLGFVEFGKNFDDDPYLQIAIS